MQHEEEEEEVEMERDEAMKMERRMNRINVRMNKEIMMMRENRGINKNEDGRMSMWTIIAASTVKVYYVVKLMICVRVCCEHALAST